MEDPMGIEQGLELFEATYKIIHPSIYIVGNHPFPS